MKDLFYMYNYGPNLISKEKSIFFYEFFFL
jgi:hypothetical protein